MYAVYVGKVLNASLYFCRFRVIFLFVLFAVLRPVKMALFEFLLPFLRFSAILSLYYRHRRRPNTT